MASELNFSFKNTTKQVKKDNNAAEVSDIILHITVSCTCKTCTCRVIIKIKREVYILQQNQDKAAVIDKFIYDYLASKNIKIVSNIFLLFKTVYFLPFWPIWVCPWCSSS